MMGFIQQIKEKIENGTLIFAIQKTIKGFFYNIQKKVKYHNAHYFVDPERVFTKKLLETFPPIQEQHQAIGNYFLDRRVPLGSSSIIYSVGILQEISFDKKAAELFDAQLFMYDPTPSSIAFMKQYESHSNFNFFPFGVWVENTVLKFFMPSDGSSATVFGDEKAGQFFEASCKTLATLMKANGHLKIDVLKMDIEGAALPILEQMIEEQIFPDQIVVELERPLHDIPKNIDFFYRCMKVCEHLKAAEYEVYTLPRTVAKYYSMEFLFVKKSAILNESNR